MAALLGLVENQGDLIRLLEGSERGVVESLDVAIYLVKMCRVLGFRLEELLPGPVARLVDLARLAGFDPDISGYLIEGLGLLQSISYLAWSLR